jgi:hypothetical protein
MAEKVKTPTTKVVAPGGVLAPPKDPVAQQIAAEKEEKKLVTEKTARADAVRKAVAEQSPEKEADEQEADQETPEPSEAPKPDTVQPGGAATKSQWSAEAEASFTRISEKARAGNSAREDGHRAHLENWHGMGGDIHSHLGDNYRHSYGHEFVKEAARRCKTSESELHKAAKFYRLQPDLNAFLAANPKLNTVSKVKGWLPGDGTNEDQRKRKKHRALVARVQFGLKELRQGLSAGLRANVAAADLLDLAQDLSQTTEQVLALTSSEKPATSEPAEEPTT